MRRQTRWLEDQMLRDGKAGEIPVKASRRRSPRPLKRLNTALGSKKGRCTDLARSSIVTLTLMLDGQTDLPIVVMAVGVEPFCRVARNARHQYRAMPGINEPASSLQVMELSAGHYGDYVPYVVFVSGK